MLAPGPSRFVAWIAGRHLHRGGRETAGRGRRSFFESLELINQLGT
jgi:hypothetical protein